MTILRVDRERVAALEEALAALGSAPSPLRVRVAARLAIELAYAPDAARREAQARGRSTRASVAGRWEDAARLTDRAIALGQRAGDGNATLIARLFGFQRTLAEERFEDVPLEFIAERMRTSPAGWAYRQSYIWCLAALGRTHEARAQLDVVRAAGGPRAWPRDTNWLSAAQELAEAAWLLEERELGAELAELLSPFADRIVSSTRGLSDVGPVTGVLARLDDLRGDRAAAAAHYEESIARAHAARAPVWALRDRRRLGELGFRPQVCGVPR